MGRAPDGSTERRHVQRRSKTELRDAVRELEHRRDTEVCTWIRHGDPTLGDWLEHWLDAVLPMTVRWKTLSTYRSQMRLHVVPALGGWRMSEIQPSTWRSTTAGCRPTGTPRTPSAPRTACCDPR